MLYIACVVTNMASRGQACNEASQLDLRRKSPGAEPAAVVNTERCEELKTDLSQRTEAEEYLKSFESLRERRPTLTGPLLARAPFALVDKPLRYADV